MALSDIIDDASTPARLHQSRCGRPPFVVVCHSFAFDLAGQGASSSPNLTAATQIQTNLRESTYWSGTDINTTLSLEDMQQVDLSAVTAFELINALKTRLSSTVAETNTRMLQALEYKIASVLAISRMELNRRVIPLPPDSCKILWLVPGPGVEPETSVWNREPQHIRCDTSLARLAASRGPNAPIRQYIHDLTYDPEVKPHPLDLTLTSQPMTNDIMDDPYSGPRQVRLDHLRKITFAAKKNPRPSIIRFLDHIDFDPHVVVSFVVPSSFEGFDLAGLISGCAGAITRLRLDEPPDGSCTICAVGPRCRFQAVISGYPANEFCKSFADNLPLAAVRELWVRSYPFTLLQSFFNNATLERCSTLDTLVVCDHSLSESLQLLSFEVHPSFNRTYASLTTLRVLWTSTKPNMVLMDNEFWDAKKLHGAFGVSLKHLIFEVPKEVGFQMDDAFVECMRHFSEFVTGAFFVPPTPDVSYASPKFRAVEWPAW
ncbi:hypothetical protein A0H81_01827 [Grifola frondosa]|uniref:Uncharacterized protein n=1 Tax=Grifola frondosa TaxID=5627 RepID=A0A1C7MLV7_GRIFR|nr:hypothetical protein A0H81_01827 [Grifola frondosa]